MAAAVSLPAQSRGARPWWPLPQRVLARAEPGFDPGMPLRPLYDDVYAINATSLAWNREQARMPCVAYGDGASGARQRRGVAMHVGADGRPFHVSSVNWRDHSDATCRASIILRVYKREDMP